MCVLLKASNSHQCIARMQPLFMSTGFRKK